MAIQNEMLQQPTQDTNCQEPTHSTASMKSSKCPYYKKGQVTQVQPKKEKKLKNRGKNLRVFFLRATLKVKMLSWC